MLAVAALAALPAQTTAAPRAKIEVLSNRADLVSDGQALVQVTLAGGARWSRTKVVLGPRGVKRSFSRRAVGRYVGIVKGLKVGKNTLAVRLPRSRGSKLTITNHPNGGPVFAGPQPQPWTCQKGALDKQCNKPARFDFLYKPRPGTTSKKGLQPYAVKNPPENIATTTTQTGERVPFIVRVETGYQDRDQYKIATLFQPGKPWTWDDPQPQFNHKAVITHGFSCGVSYEAGGAPSVTKYDQAGDLIGFPYELPVLEDSAISALASGYAVMSTALDHNGHNCNLVTQAESLVMAKEHLVENYGSLRYTIGTGCSGGSLTVQWVSNAYPGIYQGILPTCSFPDTWSSATQVMDYHLLRQYFENPGKQGVPWLPTQWSSVEGSVLPVNAIVSDIGFFGAIVPTSSCGGTTAATRYHPQTNIGGVRCSISELSINPLGPREPVDWSANERKLGRGFAGVPVDNVGVQYGLYSLKTGVISPAQFVDLNARIGGVDVDINPIAERISATRPALANAYRTGLINETNNLDKTAIIDCRGMDPGAAHDSYRAFAVRQRLDRENGHHGNHSIWEGAAPLIGDTKCAANSLRAMDRWLARVERDRSSKPIERKLVDNKPAEAGDQCWTGVGIKLHSGLCGQLIDPIYGTPRTVAGEQLTTDKNKCRLKPLDPRDYGGKGFTSAQWAQLGKTFPTGVCDFAQMGVDQQPTISWLRYGSAKKAIYGGRAMPAVPRSATCKWRKRRGKPATCVVPKRRN